MAMRAIETERMVCVRSSAIIRQADIIGQDDADAFMDTFDQEVTVGDETWETWAKKNHVVQFKFPSEFSLLMAMSSSPFNS